MRPRSFPVSLARAYPGSTTLNREVQHRNRPDGGHGEGSACIVPAASNRWVIVHYHIFKNAGSTIEYVLRRAFGGGFATVHGPAPDSVLRQEDLLSFLASHPDVLAVSSHHLSYPKPSVSGLIVFDLCFLRDPIQRLWSLYRYLRRVESFDEVSAAARALPVRQFFELMTERHPHLVNDVQVNMIANRGAYTRPPALADLRVAVDVLRQMSILGVVDLFDESLVAAEYFLQPTFPRLQFQYVMQNAGPALGPNGGDKETPREEIGDELYRRLESLNRLDYRLLVRARQEVRRRFALTPRCEERLSDFRSRCEALRRAHRQRSAE